MVDSSPSFLIICEKMPSPSEPSVRDLEMETFCSSLKGESNSMAVPFCTTKTRSSVIKDGIC